MGHPTCSSVHEHGATVEIDYTYRLYLVNLDGKVDSVIQMFLFSMIINEFAHIGVSLFVRCINIYVWVGCNFEKVC